MLVDSPTVVDQQPQTLARCGVWSKRGALLIVLVVGMYSPTVVD
jgi:hypothetical protein